MVMPLKPEENVLSVSCTAGTCRLAGDWNVQALSLRDEVVHRRQALQAAGQVAKWDLASINKLDAVGAQLLWQQWGQQIPAGTVLSSGQQALFKILAEHPIAPPPPASGRDWFGWLLTMGQGVLLSLIHI